MPGGTVTALPVLCQSSNNTLTHKNIYIFSVRLKLCCQQCDTRADIRYANLLAATNLSSTLNSQESAEGPANSLVREHIQDIFEVSVCQIQCQTCVARLLEGFRRGGGFCH